VQSEQDFWRAKDKYAPHNALSNTANILKIAEANKRYLIGIGYNEEMPLTVGNVMDSFPADKAGVRSGDIIEKWNGNVIDSVDVFQKLSRSNRGEKVVLDIKRGDKKIQLTLVPEQFRLFATGLVIGLKDHPNPLQQFYATVDMSYKSLRGLLTTVGNMIGVTEKTSSIQLRHMSGPAGIADTLFNAVHQSSIMTGIYFVVVICFALAIFNLMPLPVLDGGHIVFALIEIIFRRPLPKCVISVLSYIFIGLLILMMIYVSFFDILRLAPDSWRAKFEKTEQVTK
jgi:regulator of sigma E protease